jgi:catechol 2,3-dioxygenase-like lactoylglutathione lyase family enzyme
VLRSERVLPADPQPGCRALYGFLVITGAHAIIFTPDPEGVRTFVRDVLGFASVDAGEGWLIFALPPAELAAHPAEDDRRHELYLICDDIEATVDELKRKGVDFACPISDEGRGLRTAFAIPGGGELALYEPRHPSPLAPEG